MEDSLGPFWNTLPQLILHKAFTIELFILNASYLYPLKLAENQGLLMFWRGIKMLHWVQLGQSRMHISVSYAIFNIFRYL